MPAVQLAAGPTEREQRLLGRRDGSRSLCSLAPERFGLGFRAVGRFPCLLGLFIGFLHALPKLALVVARLDERLSRLPIPGPELCAFCLGLVRGGSLTLGS
jgi:hypothetical protein